MTTIASPTLPLNLRPAAAHRPHRQRHANSSTSSSQRLENCRLLIGRISQQLFNGALRGHTDAHPPTAARPRQTIQTDYISTISSLVDRSASNHGSSSPYDPSAATTTTAATAHNVQHDAQSANFGLYALKCHRSGLGRPSPAAAAAPPECRVRRKQWRPAAPVALDEPHAADTANLISESLAIRMRRPPDRPPVPVTLRSTPRKARAPLQPPPTPPTPPSLCAVRADRNARAMLVLDTVYLAPLLVETAEPLDRPTDTAAVTAVESGRFASPSLQSARSLSPPVVCQAAIVQQPCSPALRCRCEHVTTGSDQFANFAAELVGSSVVAVGGQPRTEYVERFARAFTAAFSEEAGCDDDDDGGIGNYVNGVLGDVTPAPVAQMQTTAQQVDHKSVSGCPHSDLIKSSADNDDDEDDVGDDGINQSWGGAEAMMSFATLSTSNNSNNNNAADGAADASCRLLSGYEGAVDGRQWPQQTPASQPFVCSPILEVLNDEQYGDDDDEGTSNGCSDLEQPHGDNDINGYSIGGGRPHQPLTPARSSLTAAVSVGQPSDAMAASGSHNRADNNDDNYADRPSDRSMLSTGWGGKVDNGSGACAVGVDAIVRRTVYIVDL